MKKVKKGIEFLSIIICYQLVISCVFPTETCEEGMRYFKGDGIHMALTILDCDLGGFRTDYSGTSLVNGKGVRFKTNDTHYSRIFEYVEIGDTLIKNNGSSNILLSKKDSVLVFSFSCQNDFTKTDILSFKKPLSSSDTLTIEKLLK
jgi:hypothetical protein